MSRLQITDDLLTLNDEDGQPILEACSANVQLSNGISFPLHGMDRQVELHEDSLTITAGGDSVLPEMVWQTVILESGHARITLKVTNTTPKALPIERLDVLVCGNGYRSIKATDLTLRRTGWQTFSPASLATPLHDIDHWLQPPLYAPIMPPSSSQQQSLSWMTVLKAAGEPPLLIGFGGAKEYLGTIDVQAIPEGHRIVATNHVEGVELQPGQSCISEPLVIMGGAPEDTLLGWYGNFVGIYMNARIPDHTPTGWSHWLYYFAQVTEADILENTHIIAEKDLPFEYIQVDDGYQTAFGDWLSINDKFPHGMKYVAEQIQAAGRKPGIWLSPFMASAQSEVVAEHPEWFLKDIRGKLINVNRHGDPYWPCANYGLDITHPEAYAWLENILKTMCEEWGYQYIKADFLYAGAIRAVRYDTSCTSVQAYRKGMELIRRIAGDRLVLGCGAPLLCSVGMVDDMRIGPDLSWEFDTPGVVQPPDATRPSSREPLLSLFSHQWMNQKLWINDADYIRVRQHHINLDWPQTIALTTLIALGGGALYNSDKLAELEPEGYALMDRIYPAAISNAHPVGPVQGRPERLLQTTVCGNTTWHIAAYFNWSEMEIAEAFDYTQWGLPEMKYHVYDLIEGQYLGVSPAEALPSIVARGVGLYCLCEVRDTPQVIATAGHLLGPLGDVGQVVWDENKLTVQLTNGRRTPTEVFVSVPANTSVDSCKGCSISETKSGIITIIPETNEFTVSFAA